MGKSEGKTRTSIFGRENKEGEIRKGKFGRRNLEGEIQKGKVGEGNSEGEVRKGKLGVETLGEEFGGKNSEGGILERRIRMGTIRTGTFGRKDLQGIFLKGEF